MQPPESGPEWRLADAHPIHGRLRRAAAEDAQLRAQDYAAGPGLRLGSVASVVEPGLVPVGFWIGAPAGCGAWPPDELRRCR